MSTFQPPTPESITGTGFAPPGYVQPAIALPKRNTKRNLILAAVVAVVLCLGASAAVTAAQKSTTPTTDIAATDSITWPGYTNAEVADAYYRLSFVDINESDACDEVAYYGESGARSQWVTGFMSETGTGTLRLANLTYTIFRAGLPC